MSGVTLKTLEDRISGLEKRVFSNADASGDMTPLLQAKMFRDVLHKLYKSTGKEDLLAKSKLWDEYIQEEMKLPGFFGLLSEIYKSLGYDTSRIEFCISHGDQDYQLKQLDCRKKFHKKNTDATIS